MRFWNFLKEVFGLGRPKQELVVKQQDMSMLFPEPTIYAPPSQLVCQKEDKLWIVTPTRIIEYEVSQFGVEELPHDTILCYKNDRLVIDRTDDQQYKRQDC